MSSLSSMKIWDRLKVAPGSLVSIDDKDLNVYFIDNLSGYYLVTWDKGIISDGLYRTFADDKFPFTDLDFTEKISHEVRQRLLGRPFALLPADRFTPLKRKCDLCHENS